MTEAPRRFGDYVLFKRLGADSLGESYRAGRVAGASIERVVLLRLFNGRTVDRPGLWRAVADRGPIQKLATSARLAEGIELGVVAGTPFAAYSYVSGPNLLELLSRARARPFPIPTEHALFIAERVAQRLAAARETRMQGERIHHGFLVPALVSLSVEGEVQVLGTELAPGLRAQLTLRAEADIAPYLAPATDLDGKAHSADDVYSLGAILQELLTGAAPSTDAEKRAAELGAARLAIDGSPLPQPVVDLLRNSLAPRESRIPGVDDWHRVLAKLIHEGEYGPTTFNFAFFMHTLFRQEIDGEREEIELERRQEVPLAAAEAPPAPAAPAAPAPAAPATPAPAAPAEPAPAAPASPVVAGRAAAARGARRRRWLLPTLLAAIFLTAGLLAAFYFFDWAVWTGTGPGDETAAPAEPAASAESPLEDPVAAADPQPSVEEVEAEVRELLAQRTPEMEAEVRTEFEAKLAGLRRQLADARAAARRRQEAEERAAADEAKDAPPAGGGPSPGQPPPAPAAAGPPAQPAAEPEPAPPAETAAVEERPRARDAVGGEESAETGSPAAAGPDAAAPPATEAVAADPGPEVVPPSMLSRPQPRYPPAARKFGKEATVRLRLLIDERGRVVDSEPIGPPAGFGFDEAAVQAARKTAWSPATRDGTPVEAWVELAVEFRP